MAGEPEKGDKVSWEYGGSNPSGEVAEKKTEGKVEVTSHRGNKISRNAKPGDPAVAISRSGNDVVKNASDLKVNKKRAADDKKDDKKEEGKEPEKKKVKGEEKKDDKEKEKAAPKEKKEEKPKAEKKEAAPKEKKETKPKGKGKVMKEEKPTRVSTRNKDKK